MTLAVSPAHSFEYGGASIIVYHANKGEGLPRHDHTVAHAIMCNTGSCMIRKENIEKLIDKTTQPIDLKAKEWHEIEALEDNTVFVTVFSIGS
jgi:quercetin dioxygenase-like cupin family protein